jgi:hypothetical protein
MSTDFRRLSTKYLEFSKIQPRGNFHFTSTKYKNGSLIIETPFLVTPTGIQSEDTRNWMDVELDVASNRDHQIFYDVIKSIDDRCIDETIDHMDKWFPKGKVDETFIEEQFKSPITSGWGNEPALLRFEIHAEEPESLMDTEGNVISPSDVTALSTVKVQMQLLGVWVSEKFLGCHWRAIRIVANLDHETSGRRRSESPPRRAESPLPPVQARANPRQSEPASSDSSTRSAPKKREEVAAPQQPKKREEVAAPKKREEVVAAPKRRVVKEPQQEEVAPQKKRTTVVATEEVPARKRVVARKPVAEIQKAPEPARHSSDDDRRSDDEDDRHRHYKPSSSSSSHRHYRDYSDEDSYERRRYDSRDRRRSYSDDSYER